MPTPGNICPFCNQRFAATPKAYNANLIVWELYGAQGAIVSRLGHLDCPEPKRRRGDHALRL